MASKHASIEGLVARLDLAERRWVVVDHQEAHLCAIAIAAAVAPRRIVHVSTFGKAAGRYDYECEIPTGPDLAQRETIRRGQDVDLGTLTAVLEAHLPYSNGYGRPATVDELRAALEGLVGLPCWSVVAGPGTGSVVSMKLGARIPRDRPLTNPYLTADERAFSSEHGLFVNSDWRLDNGFDVLCSSQSSNEAGGPMVSGLAALIGRSVTEFELRAPVHDLTVWFGDDRRFSIFCDLTPDASEDYVVFVPGGSVSAGPVGVIDRESRG